MGNVISWQLGCFCFLAVVYRAAMNMTGQASVEHRVKSFGHGSKNDVGGAYITNLALGFLFGFVVLFLEFSKLVSRVGASVCIPPTVKWGFLSSHPHHRLLLVRFNHCISLVAKDVEYFFEMLPSHFNSFF